MDEIGRYIDGENQDFGAGLALYLEHGRSKQLKRLFSNRNPNASLLHKLRYELGKLIGRNVIIEACTKIQPAPSAGQTHNSNVHLEAQVTRTTGRLELPMILQDDLPEVDQDELAKRKRSLHAERAKLSNSLHLFAMDDESGRAAAVSRIKELTSEMNEIRLEQRGEQPQLKAIAAIAVKELPTAIGDLMSERNNLRSNISKAKAKLSQHQIGTANYLKYRSKLEALESRLKEVEALIG